MTVQYSGRWSYTEWIMASIALAGALIVMVKLPGFPRSYNNSGNVFVEGTYRKRSLPEVFYEYSGTVSD